jgi:hypothetical protein
LLADLAYVEETMTGVFISWVKKMPTLHTGPSADRERRERMLRFHADFLKVLNYHKDKLKPFCLPGVQSEAPREYDPRFDLYNNLP